MAIGKINKVKADLRSYPPYIFLAPKKFGKTTFWDDLVKKAWGDATKGLLISCGNEEGYHALDGIQVVVCKNWTDDYNEETGEGGLAATIDYIVEHNDELGICGVAFDTLDTFIEIGTAEVLRQHKKEKGTTCKSLNDAFGGYGRGKGRLLSISNEQVEKLRDAGIAVFFLCHIKMKEQTDLMSGEKYEQITNNLTDDIFSNFADAAQMVMVGTFDREIVNGKMINENRVVYLRGNSLVNAGSRFDTLPEKISGDRDNLVDEFLAAFEGAVKGAIKTGKNDDKSLEKAKKEEAIAREKKAEEARKKLAEKSEEDIEAEKSEYLTIISTKFPNADSDVKAKARDMLKDAGYAKFTDPEIPVELIKTISELF